MWGYLFTYCYADIKCILIFVWRSETKVMRPKKLKTINNILLRWEIKITN